MFNSIQNTFKTQANAANVSFTSSPQDIIDSLVPSAGRAMLQFRKAQQLQAICSEVSGDTRTGIPFTKEAYLQLLDGMNAIGTLVGGGFTGEAHFHDYSASITNNSAPPPETFYNGKTWVAQADTISALFDKLVSSIATHHAVPEQIVLTSLDIAFGAIKPKLKAQIVVLDDLVLSALQNPDDPQVKSILNRMPAASVDEFHQLFNRKSNEIAEIARRELIKEVAEEEERRKRSKEQQEAKRTTDLNARLKSDQQSLFEGKRESLNEASYQQATTVSKAVSINKTTSSEKDGPWRKVKETKAITVLTGVAAFLTQRYNHFKLNERVSRWIGANPEQVRGFVDRDDQGMPIQRYNRMKMNERCDQIMRHDSGGIIALLANERFRRQYLIESASGHFLKARCCHPSAAKDLEQMPWGIASLGITEGGEIFHFFAEQGTAKAPNSAPATNSGTSERVRLPSEEGCAITLNGNNIRVLRVRPDGVSSILEIAPK